MSVLPPLTKFVDLLAASENAVPLVFHAYRFSRCGSRDPAAAQRRASPEVAS
jgi:hypothetical protein